MNEREAACLARVMDACPNVQGECWYTPHEYYDYMMQAYSRTDYHEEIGLEHAMGYCTIAVRIGFDYVLFVNRPHKLNAILDLRNMRLYARDGERSGPDSPMQVFQLERIDNAF